MIPARRDSAGPFKNRVRIGAPNLPRQVPLIVHYLRWLRMAPDLHECHASLRLTRKEKPSADGHGESWRSKIMRRITIRNRMRIEPHPLSYS